MKRKVVALALAVVLSISMSVTAFAEGSSSGTGSNSGTTGSSSGTGSNSGTTGSSSGTGSNSGTTGSSSGTGSNSSNTGKDDENSGATNTGKDDENSGATNNNTRPNTSPTTESNSNKSNSTSSSSSSQASSASELKTVEKALPGGEVAPETVQVAVVDANGQVLVVSLAEVANSVEDFIVASAAIPGNGVLAVQALLTSPASPFFIETVASLEEAKGGNVVVNNMGTVKTAAVATDAFGNTIAAAGVIDNVTSGALVMLMGVNADGMIEYVEGVVDPITGIVMGIFQSEPVVITVIVLA